MMSQNDAKWYKMVQIKKKEVKMRWTKCEKKVKFTILFIVYTFFRKLIFIVEPLPVRPSVVKNAILSGGQKFINKQIDKNK